MLALAALVAAVFLLVAAATGVAVLWAATPHRDLDDA